MERFSLATVLSVITVLWTPALFIKFVDGGKWFTTWMTTHRRNPRRSVLVPTNFP